MKRRYEVADRTDKRAITEFLKREGQFLLPMVELVERTEMAIDEVIDEVGRATLGAVLEMSAEGVAGPKQAGKRREEGSVVWYGRQGGPGVPVGPKGPGGSPPAPAEDRG
jgi:hypothetical protein